MGRYWCRLSKLDQGKANQRSFLGFDCSNFDSRSGDNVGFNGDNARLYVRIPEISPFSAAHRGLRE